MWVHDWSATMAQGFPLKEDTFYSTLTELLMIRGHTREVYIVAAGSLKIESGSYDRWDGGLNGWELHIGLPPKVFARLTEDVSEAVATTILAAANEVIGASRNHAFECVPITPLAVTRADWKHQALQWVRGEGVNNQGRVRSDKLPYRQEDGLLFRSMPEIHFYRALKEQGVAFAPLPVFLHGGPKYRRIEPDFILLKDGVLMVIELDGDSFHTESPAEADQRLAMLKYEGARIEHISASECETPEKAKVCAAKVLALMEKLKGL